MNRTALPSLITRRFRCFAVDFIVRLDIARLKLTEYYSTAVLKISGENIFRNRQRDFTFVLVSSYMKPILLVHKHKVQTGRAEFAGREPPRRIDKRDEKQKKKYIKRVIVTN